MKKWMDIIYMNEHEWSEWKWTKTNENENEWKGMPLQWTGMKIKRITRNTNEWKLLSPEEP